jgi:hypothetical protein
MDASQNDNTLARVPVEQPKPEPQAPQKPAKPPEITFDPIKPPPSAYAEVKKHPLIVDLLEYKEQLPHFEVKAQSKEIDSFIREEMSRIGLKDELEAYKSVLEDYIKKAQIPKEADIYAKLDRLIEYIRIQKKLYDAFDEREKLLKKDIKDLTSKQIEELINDNQRK